MTYIRHIHALNELSASEGVFTTAQAQRLDITRGVLAYACSAARAERICRGAYRLAGTAVHETDELSAIWKLTKPDRFSWERQRDWDGIAIGGTTAAHLLGIGDFFLSPYRLYAPRRVNSRSTTASFGTRVIDLTDIVWIHGLPVTNLERTLVDLCLDREDPSLITDAFHDAVSKGMSLSNLNELITKAAGNPKSTKALKPLTRLIDMSERNDAI